MLQLGRHICFGRVQRSSDPGSISDPSRRKASKALEGRSVGEVLSGGTERVASASRPRRPAPAQGLRKAAFEERRRGGALWLLLALGAITAVAAGGVALRRRQARQGFGG